MVRVAKRILQIVADLEPSGAQRQMTRLALGLLPAGFDVHVCALGRGGPLADELARAGIPVEVLGRRWPTDPRAFRRLYQLVGRLRPALIHTWQTAAHAWGYAAARLTGVRRFAMTQHRCEHGLGPLGRWQLRQVAARADLIVVNSPATGECLAGHGWPAARIQAITNGVPPDGAPCTTRGQLLAELGLPPESRLIGFVGRLTERKRLKDAIWAADLVKVIRSDTYLLLIGEGPHFGRLLQFRDHVVIRDKVLFLGQRCDVARLLPHLDAYWSTSAAEGQSAALLEAMAAGVPVVATDIAGTRDLVVPDITGFLVPVGDRAGFARNTNDLLDDAALAARLSAAARQRAAAAFPLTRMIADYTARYETLVG